MTTIWIVVAGVLLIAKSIQTLRQDKQERDKHVPMKSMRDYWLIDRWGGGSG